MELEYSTRRIQIRFDYFCLGIILEVIQYNFQNTVVSKVSYPFWFVGKLIFCRLVLDVQSSCTLYPLAGPELVATNEEAGRPELAAVDHVTTNGGFAGAGVSQATTSLRSCAQKPRTIRGDLAAASRLPEVLRPPGPRVPSVRSLRQVPGEARLVRLPDAARIEASSVVGR